MNGGISGTAALIGYNVFKNPSWFKYALNPLTYVIVLAFYATLYNDRGAVGGLAAGYLAFLSALLWEKDDNYECILGSNFITQII